MSPRTSEAPSLKEERSCLERSVNFACNAILIQYLGEKDPSKVPNELKSPMTLPDGRQLFVEVNQPEEAVVVVDLTGRLIYWEQLEPLVQRLLTEGHPFIVELQKDPQWMRLRCGLEASPQTATSAPDNVINQTRVGTEKVLAV